MKRNFASRQPMSSQRGLALLEILIAMSLFSLVVLAVARAYLQTTTTAQLSSRVSEATLGLKNQLALVQANRTSPGEYDLSADGSGIRYHLKIDPVTQSTLIPVPLEHTYQVTLTATWQEGSRTYLRQIHCLKSQP